MNALTETRAAVPLLPYQSRRTFAIISHPDAGKTTLTEKAARRLGRQSTRRVPCAAAPIPAPRARLDGDRAAARHLDFRPR